MRYSKEALVKLAKFTEKDLELIRNRRRKHNQLGFAYQLAFVKLHNRLPIQEPFELIEELIGYVSIQLEINVVAIEKYSKREATISEHQRQIRTYLKLTKFSDAAPQLIEQFIFEQACRLEQTHALLSLTRDFLRKQSILEPAESTLKRLIHQQRQKARTFIFDKIHQLLSIQQKEQLDKLLLTESKTYSLLHYLKQSTTRASASSIIKITEKLDKIKATGILDVDLSWLNNNLQRWMNRYVRKTTAFRIKELKEKRRYALLVCFLKQHYRDLTDDLVKNYDKVMNQMYNRTQIDLDKQHRKQRKTIRTSLEVFQTVADAILDESIADVSLRAMIFKQVGKDALSNRRDSVKNWLSSKHKDVFTLLVNTRFSYLRQFAPTLLEHLSLEKEDAKDDTLLEAVKLIKEMNQSGKRKLEADTPISFMPKSTQNLVVKSDGQIDKPAWECALLTAVKDNIKSGNIAIKDSKRYGHINDFFMPLEKWEARRDSFFKRAGLPSDPEKVKDFLTKRLDLAFDEFLERLPKNKYAQLDEKGWQVSKDESEELSKEEKEKLEKIQAYLAKHMRIIKLPQLLIEVDNELSFSRHFMSPSGLRKKLAAVNILQFLSFVEPFELPF